MNKEELFERLSLCVEKGKADKATPTPPEMKDMIGAKELTQELLDLEVPPDQILNTGLIPGMKRIGDLYSEGRAFVPHLLLAARAMNESVTLLQPFFEAGIVKRKGKH